MQILEKTIKEKQKVDVEALKTEAIKKKKKTIVVGEKIPQH